MDLAQLSVSINVKGADTASSALKRTKTELSDTAKSAESFAGALSGIEIPAIAAAGAIGALIGNIRGLLVGVANFTGVSVASEFLTIELSVQRLTRSLMGTKQVMQGIKALAKETPYDALNVAQFSTQLLGGGTKPGDVTGQARSLLDVSTFAGVGREDLPRFLENISQIRGSARPEERDLKEMFQSHPAMIAAFRASTGNQNLTQSDVFKMLQGGTGEQAFQMLLKVGNSKGVKGSAADAAANDPALMLANTLETLRNSMEPTGKMLLAVLKPVGWLLSKVADAIQYINDVTGGSGGLIMILGIVIKSWSFLTGSLKMAYDATVRLTQAVIAYGEAANTHRPYFSGGGGSASQTAEGMSAGRYGAEGMGAAGKVISMTLPPAEAAAVAAKMTSMGIGSGAMRATAPMDPALIAQMKAAAGAAEAAKAVSWGSRLLGLAKGAVAFLPMLVDMGLNLAGDAVGKIGADKDTGQTSAKWGPWGAALKGMGTGAGIGGMIGMIGGPAGIGLGALIGGIVGGISFGIGDILQRKNEAADKKQTQAVEDNTAALKEINGRIIGGGSRASGMGSLLDMDYGLGRLMRTGAG